jgi:hypothetical protein
LSWLDALSVCCSISHAGSLFSECLNSVPGSFLVNGHLIAPTTYSSVQASQINSLITHAPAGIENNGLNSAVHWRDIRHV